MIKRKKIIFSSVLIFLVCSILVFSKPVSRYSLLSVINLFTKKMVVDFKSFEIRNRKIRLKKVVLTAKKKYKIEIDKLDINFALKLFRPEVDLTVVCKKPYVSVYKNAIWKAEEKKKNRFVNCFFKVTEGTIGFVDEDKIVKKLYFDYSKNSKVAHLNLSVEEELEKKINVDINKNNNLKNYTCYLNEFDCSHLNDLFKFFDLNNFQDIKGVANGIILFDIKENKINRFFSDLDCSSLSFQNDLTGLKLDFKNVKIETTYPETLKHNKCQILNNLKYGFLKETKVRLNFENLDIATLKKTFFSNIQGSFSYNPNLGSKFFINGKVENDKVFDFKIESKAYINSSFSNWLDLDCFLDNDQAHLSLEAKEVEDFYNIHLKCTNIKSHVFLAVQDLLYKPLKIKDFKFIDGDLNFCLDGKFDEKGFHKIILTDLSLSDFDFEKNRVKGCITKLEGQSSFDLDCPNFWDKFFIDVRISDNSFIINNQKIQKFNAKLFALDGVFQSSFFSFFLDEIETKAKLTGNIENFNVLLNSKGKFQNLDDYFLSNILCKRKDKKYLFSGNIQISDGQEAVFGFDLNRLVIFNFEDFKKHLSKGWIRAEKVLLKKWSKNLNRNFTASGLANIVAIYQKEKLKVQLKGEDLAFHNQYLDLKINKIGNLSNFIFEKHNYIEAVLDKDALYCSVPEFEGSCFLPRFNLLLDLKKASINIDKNILRAQVQGASENVVLDGSVNFDFSQQCPLLSVNVSNFGSDIRSMQSLLKHFSFFNDLDLKGALQGNARIFTCFEKRPQIFYDVNFDFDKTSYKINEKTSLTNLQAKLNYRSDSKISFSELKGNLQLENKSYLVSCPVLRKIKDNLEFDLRIGKNILDILRIKGKALKENNSFQVHLNKNKTHLFGQKFKDLDLSLDENLNMTDLKVFINLTANTFISNLQFLLDLNILPINNINLLSYITKYKGNFDLSVKLDESKKLIFEILSKDFKVFDQKIQKFYVKAKTGKSNIEFEKIILNDVDSSLVINVKDNNLEISDCIFKQKNALFFKLKGLYEQKSSILNTDISDIKVDLKKIRPVLSRFLNLPKSSIEGFLKGKGLCLFYLPSKDQRFNCSFDLDLQSTNLVIDKIRLYNNEFLNLKFSLDKGFSLRGLDFSFYNKNLDLSSLRSKIGLAVFNLKDQRWLFKDTSIYLPKVLIDSIKQKTFLSHFFEKMSFNEDVEINCDLEADNNFSNISVDAQKVFFIANNIKHNLKNVNVTLNSKKWLFNFDYFLKNEYYHIENLFNFSKTITAKTIFYDKSVAQINPLVINWLIDEDRNFQIKEMSGYFCGACFLFQEDLTDLNPNSLFGSIKIDNSKLKKILPSNIEKMLSQYSIGNGYEISGRLNIDPKNYQFNFSGLFSGKDFEMLGYQFKTIFSKIEISPKKIKFDNFKISDQSGILNIREMLFEKNNKKWFLSIPFLKIKDLRPSLMKKINKPLKELTPFLIRDLKLYDLKGDLSSKKSFTGKGDLYFINSFKRGHSVFDFPSDVLSRIVGLDQELLTPVKGNVDFIVNDAKVYLQCLKDAFSEGKRSTFFLIEKKKKTYIDFDGNIYINIAMKQHVLFKFTESFIISIRGNLGKPQCNLKKKRGFLN